VFAITASAPEGVEVNLVYPRPISQRTGEVSIIAAETKKEVDWLNNLDELDPISREVAEAALYDRYRIAIIQSVSHSHVNHGHRYLKVETDRGSRYFNLKEPGKNVTNLTPDHLIIRDSMGNRYEVPSLKALDEESRERLEMVL